MNTALQSSAILGPPLHRVLLYSDAAFRFPFLPLPSPSSPTWSVVFSVMCSPVLRLASVPVGARGKGERRERAGRRVEEEGRSERAARNVKDKTMRVRMVVYLQSYQRRAERP